MVASGKNRGTLDKGPEEVSAAILLEEGNLGRRTEHPGKSLLAGGVVWCGVGREGGTFLTGDPTRISTGRKAVVRGLF